jgi:hypothetical protein
MRSHLPEDNTQHIFFVFPPDFYVPVCGRRFAVGYSSHVRLHLPFRIATISPDQVLIDAASIAIWNRNKVVMVMSISLWVIGVAFHIQS